MAVGRQNSILFAFKASRHLVNHPVELSLSRAGIFRGESVESMIRKLQTEDPVEFGDTHVITKMNSKVVESSQFPYLSQDQKGSMYIWTLISPEFYAEFSKDMYSFDVESRESSSRVTRWGPMLSALDSGLAKLCEQEGCDDRLVRVAWIPNEVYTEHFVKDNEIVVRAPMSAAPTEQWQFLNIGDHTGKTAVVLEFDKAACMSAAKIVALSAVPDENERLFRPYFNGRVTLVEPEGAVSPAGVKLPRLFITGIPEFPCLQSILDAEKVPLAKILSLTILISVHTPEEPENCSSPDLGSLFRHLIEKLETALEMAAKIKNAELVKNRFVNILVFQREAIKATWRESRESWAEGYVGHAAFAAFASAALIIPPCAWLLQVLDVSGMARNVRGAERREQYDEEENQKRREQIQKARGYVENSSADEVKREIQDMGLQTLMDIKPPPCDQMLRQFRTLIPQMCKDCSSTDESTYLNRWVALMVAAEFVEKLVGGEFSDAYDFPKIEDHWKVTLGVGDAVYGEVPTDDHAAAQFAIANVVHLRMILARMRLLIPVGVFDAGKSTVLKKFFGVNVKTGLDTCGRTSKISMHPLPGVDISRTPMFVADGPGIADAAAPERNDCVRIIVSLASDPGLRDVIHLLRVHRSGRKATDITALEKMLGRTSPVILVTHADARYEEMVCDKLQQLVDDGKEDDAIELRRNPEVRRAIANDIIAEDKDSLNQEPYYVCPVGWAMPEEDKTSRDILTGLQPRLPFLERDFREFFVVHTKSQVRQRIFESMSLQGKL